MASSILLKICEQRKKDVLEAKAKVSLETLKSQIEESKTKYPPIDFKARLRKDAAHGVSVVAEVKRASPSKGDIAPGINAGEQGLKYAKAGASAISVLTEPTWFKGDIPDMRSVREEVASLPDRPAVLRKDFLIDEYMVYEARVHGADTVLLIVAVLEEPLLKQLIDCARGLGMEPLVEVNNDEETKKALRCGASVIGVNNRNLHDFTVDASTTEKIMEGNAAALAEGDCMLCALSGIQCRSDVQRYTVTGVEMVLVGEALMRSSDPSALIREFRGLGDTVLVKACGFKDPATAVHAAKAGADFIGLVFAEGSPRTVTVAEARAIVDAVRVRKCVSGAPPAAHANGAAKRARASPRFDASHVKLPREQMVAALRGACALGPLFVGVFANQPPAEVKRLAEESGCDVIQLSGKEGWADLSFYEPFAVINAEHVAPDSSAEGLLGKVGGEGEAVLMLDTKHPLMEGGCGQTFDWGVASACQAARPTFVAGGLGPENVAECVRRVRPLAVDASSGMEEKKGVKEPRLVYQYVHAAKAAFAEEGLIR